jgi:hypothetical protein
VTAPIWIYVIGGGFSLIGLWTVAHLVVSLCRRVYCAAVDLTNTLKDAAEVAKEYREDVQILKQIAQSAPTSNFGAEPGSIIPRQEEAGSRMPRPYLERFPVKPPEPDAPRESIREVDLTATDDELVDQEKEEAALDFEVSERQKAMTREADQARLRELAELSGEPDK